VSEQETRQKPTLQNPAKTRRQKTASNPCKKAGEKKEAFKQFAR
jgi:hypothetical protein